jgi:hypothetical protein
MKTVKALQKKGFNIFAYYVEMDSPRWIMHKGNSFVVCYDDKTVFGTMNGAIQYPN